MGKLVALALALVDLGILGLLLTSGDADVLRKALLTTSFLLLGALAWVVAFFSALYALFRTGRGLRSVLLLVAFLWLPVVPVLVYGVHGLYGLFTGRDRRVYPALAASKWPLPPVNAARLRGGRSSRRLLRLRKAA
jgi:hypothetical protein